MLYVKIKNFSVYDWAHEKCAVTQNSVYSNVHFCSSASAAGIHRACTDALGILSTVIAVVASMEMHTSWRTAIAHCIFSEANLCVGMKKPKMFMDVR